jgi:hypothetical protein
MWQFKWQFIPMALRQRQIRVILWNYDYILDYFTTSFQLQKLYNSFWDGKMSVSAENVRIYMVMTYFNIPRQHSPLQSEQPLAWSRLAQNIKYHFLISMGWVQMAQYIVAYLIHARTGEPQKQPLLSNTRTQQYNNGAMQSVSRQRPGKHISAYRHVLCTAVTSSTILIVFSMWSMQSAYRRREFKG